MDLKQAKDNLFSTTPLLSYFKQNSALKYLAETNETGAIDILVEALDLGHQAKKIVEILLAQKEQERVNRLWQLWAQGRSPKLGEILKGKGVPAVGDLQVLSLLKLNRLGELPMDRGSVRRVLALLGDPDPDVQQGVISYAGLLPMTEQSADDIFGAWLKFDSTPLAEVIGRQRCKPSNPSMEALFLLVTNQVPSYLALENEEGERFQEAYALATEPLRKRLNDVVLKSGHRQLADAYEKALAGKSDFNRDLLVRARTTAGDDAGLFEDTQYMTISGLLDLCKLWSENGWRPQDPRHCDLVERAIAAYPQVGSLEITVDAPVPPGTTDLFDSFRKQNLSDKEISAGLDATDPFTRMRSLYLGAQRDLLPPGRLAKAAQSEDWPERLVARLFKLDEGQGQDHVSWVNTCTGSGELLTAPVKCNPEEYDYFGRLLKATAKADSGIAGRYRALLEILQAFQSVHGGGLEVGDDDGTDVIGAVEVTKFEEAPRV